MDGLSRQAELYKAADLLGELALDYWHASSMSDDLAESERLAFDSDALTDASVILVARADSYG